MNNCPSISMAQQEACSSLNYKSHKNTTRQQGIVTCVESPEAETEVALPADGGDDALASWRAGHAQADVTIALEEGMLPDDAAALLIKDLLAHIAKNPAMSKGWKAEADKKLAEQDGL